MPSEVIDPRVIDLQIGGMSCASCATRIERKLNRLDGVVATVNFATGRAHVESAGPGPEQLISTVESLGYSAAPPQRPAPSPPAWGPRVVLSAWLTLPVLLLAMVPALRFPGWAVTSAVLATVVVTVGGWPFHRAALLAARHGTSTMDTLVSVGALSSYGWSIVSLVTGSFDPSMSMAWLARSSAGGLYFEVGATLVTFLSVGRWLEDRAKRRAGSALRSLASLAASSASRLNDDGTETRVPVAELEVGDRFVVRPGEKVATDGMIELGESAVDASLITGESRPVAVGPGAEVVGASINADGRLVVRATRVGAQTALAQITRLVERAQTGKAPVQRLADRVAAVFVPIVLVLALATLVVWLLLGLPVSAALTAAVGVLVVACPCALGLATPTALLAGTGRGAQLGILIRGPEVLESTRRVDTVLLDKTGTVTTGVLSVVAVTPAPGVTRSRLLRLAAAVEHASEHPVARAIVAAAAGPLPPVVRFVAQPGVGVSGVVEGHPVTVGRSPSGEILVTRDGVELGSIEVDDPVKPGAAAAVARLRALGLRPILLTGDSAARAGVVAEAVGIDEVVAGVLPAGKVEAVTRLQAQGHLVAMVGDGVNDAAALAAADLGIAMGTGTDVAIQASSLTIVRSATGSSSVDLGAAADAVALARATLGTIRANLFWAFAYNVAMIPLAALGYVSPVLAAAAMALSSVLVVTNSLRLFRFPRSRSGSGGGRVARWFQRRDQL